MENPQAPGCMPVWLFAILAWMAFMLGGTSTSVTEEIFKLF